MSINRVNITGNLTRDPELRATAGGTQVLSFGVAVNDRRRNAQTGEWEDYPNFVDCTMFGTRAEAVSRFLAKGNKVAIEGKLRYSSWERDGQRRSKLDDIFAKTEQEMGRSLPAYTTTHITVVFKESGIVCHPSFRDGVAHKNHPVLLFSLPYQFLVCLCIAFQISPVLLLCVRGYPGDAQKDSNHT